MSEPSQKKFKVTKLTDQKRAGRYNVFINDQYAFPISEAVMIQFSLFKGTELTKAEIEEIKSADDVSKLYNKGVDFISYQARTEKEVRDKLHSLSENDEAIDTAIAKLFQVNLLDDENYAHAYLKGVVANQSKGPIGAARYLKQKGLDSDIIESSLNETFPHSKVIENGEKQAEKSYNHYHNQPFNQRINKTKNALFRNGYDFNDIDVIMEHMDFEPDVSDQEELLMKLGEKVWHKNRALDSYERRRKSKQALYRKGFDLDDIDQFLDSKEEN